MEVIIARHGVTHSNQNGITNGRLDEALAPEGKAQALALAERLKGLGIEKIYSSPLQRATATAQPLAKKLGQEIELDERLIEVSFGDFEGKPNQELIDHLGKGPRELFDDYKYDFSSFNGESSEQVEARVRSFLDDLKKQDYRLVLIVTHGGILRWINYLITGEKIGASPNAEELHLQS